ncbi:hypothetical protein GJD64_29150, partial [Klebsiella pneumoniae]|nr:hypothetical protein [Klebsiella pneumoniae]
MPSRSTSRRTGVTRPRGVETAMLTTFNEVNMKPIMDLRKQYGEAFEKRHGIRLGFMSFYVKA